MTKLMKRLALCLAMTAAFALALVLCGTALAAEPEGKESPRALAALDETACDTRESGGAPEIGALETGRLTRFAP